MFDPLINRPFVHAPHAIDEEVLTFCSTLNAATTPVFLAPQPWPGSVSGECYSNVDRAIASGMQGSPSPGWLIWRWPGVFIEAEHHMVLDDGSSLIDVTPPIDPEDAVVAFLPDPTAPFDPVTKRLIRNRNRTLGYEPWSREVLDAGARQKAMHGDVFGELRPVNVDEYQNAQFAAALAKDGLLKRIRANLGRNDPCLCGSGQKYKRCHGAL